MKKIILSIVLTAFFLFGTAQTNKVDPEVGTLPGTVGVSPTGAATYTIPINLPEGRDGMMPQLALVYNSQQGNNIMGKGWSISGFSSVSRGNSSLYYDYKVDAVNFEDDAFLLDGMRLIKISESNGIIEYRTEIDQIAKVLYHSSGGDVGDYFEVITKDGITKIYGNTQDSRQYYSTTGESAESPLIWHLNRVINTGYDKTSARKFYLMNYTYQKDNSVGECHPKQIDYNIMYGDNSKLGAPYKVVFHYNSFDQENQRNQYFEKDGEPYLVQNTERLDAITLQYDEDTNPLKRYILKYKYDESLTETVFLESVQLESRGPYTETKKINETVFAWDLYKPDYRVKQISDTPTDFPIGMLHIIRTAPIDMDGDGIDEIAEFKATLKENGGWDYNIHIKMERQEIIYNTGVVKGLYAADFNIDGRDELIVYYKDAFRILAFEKSGTNWNVSQNVYSNTDVSGPDLMVIPADVTGDGLIDCVVANEDQFELFIGKGSTSDYFSNDFNGGSVPAIQLDTDYTVVAVKDFTGDGQFDVLSKHSPEWDENDPYAIPPALKLKLFEFNELDNDFDLVQYFTPSNHHLRAQFYYEDFNGDGKADLLRISNPGNKSGNEHYYFPSFGSGFVNTPKMTSSTGLGYDFPIAVDINNDGRADLLTIKEIDNNKIRLKACITKQNGYSFYYTDLGDHELLDPLTYENSGIRGLTFADLRGNGILCPVFEVYHLPDGPGGKQDPDALELYLTGIYDYASYASDVIRSVTNGFGLKMRFNYAPFRNSYIENSDLRYPLGVFRTKMPLLSSVQTDNPAGGTNTIEYKFFDPVYHIQGKGFLGFGRSGVFNPQNRIYIQSLMQVLGAEKGLYLHPFNYSVAQYYLDEKSGIDFAKNELKQENLLLLTQNQVGIKTTQGANSLVYLPVVTASLTNKWELGKSGSPRPVLGTQKSIQKISDMDNYGNSLFSTHLSSEKILNMNAVDEFYSCKSTTTIRYENMDVNNWLMSRPTYMKTTKWYTGNSSIDYFEKDYLYYNSISETGWPRLEEIKTTPNGNSALETKVNYEYDIYGNIISKVVSADGNQRESSFEYSNDYQGRFLTRKHEHGENNRKYTTGYTYFEKYGLVQKEIKNPDHAHIKLEKSYHYDAFWKVNIVELPDGFYERSYFNYLGSKSSFPGKGNGDLFVKISYKYKEGNETNESKWMDQTYVYYNKFEQETAIFSWDQNGNILTSRKTYNSNGLLENEEELHFLTSMEFKSTSYEYDELGRVILLTTPNARISTKYNGFNTLVTNLNTGVWKSTTTNALDQLVVVEDQAGTIDYEYYSSGNVKEIDANGNITKMLYDDANRQKELQDPSAGLTRYIYNSFGELSSQTDAKGNQILMYYDQLGRLERKVYLNSENQEKNIYYTYQDDPALYGYGLIETINGPSVSYSYAYDYIGRLLEQSETIDSIAYTHAYTYSTENGQIESLEYPSGYKVKYLYRDNGFLHKITDLSGNMLWESIQNNGRGQLTDFSFGNGKSTHKEFDEFGFPEQIITDGVSNLKYHFDPATGNLQWREKVWFDWRLHEDFTYETTGQDSRLTSWQVRWQPQYFVNYKTNGNIQTKTDVTAYGDPLSVFNYASDAGPYAVSDVFNAQQSYIEEASNHQTIAYNEFNKVQEIRQANKTGSGKSILYSLNFLYGPDEARKQTKFYRNNIEILEKTFVGGNYEIERESKGMERKLHYLMGGDGLFAIYVQNTYGTDSLYYIHKDYLGNIESVTDKSGKVLEELSFDPWGRKRNPDDWSYTNVPDDAIFSRGFTGHEHLDLFGLINMNGRLYDPMLGRMLSPDAFVQSPTNLRDFNRYSYAFNNPLKYVDPDGNNPFIILGAAIGAMMNLYFNADHVESVGDAFMYWGIGGVAGAASAGVGLGVAGALGSGGFVAGAITGATAGFTNGALTGFGNTFVQGGNLGGAFKNSLRQGAMQGTIGAFVGGVLGGLNASAEGGNFWTGVKVTQTQQQVTLPGKGPGAPGMGMEDPIVMTVLLDEIEIVGKLAGGQGILLNSIGTILSTIGYSNFVKTELLKWGMKGADWGKIGTGYLKFNLKAGKMAGSAGAVVYGFGSYSSFANGNNIQGVSNGLMSMYSFIATKGGVPGMVVSAPFFVADWTIGMDNLLLYNVNYGIEQASQIQNGNWGLSLWRPGATLR